MCVCGSRAPPAQPSYQNATFNLMVMRARVSTLFLFITVLCGLPVIVKSEFLFLFVYIAFKRY